MNKSTARWVLERFDETRQEIVNNHGHNIPEVETLRLFIGMEMNAIIESRWYDPIVDVYYRAKNFLTGDKQL